MAITHHSSVLPLARELGQPQTARMPFPPRSASAGEGTKQTQRLRDRAAGTLLSSSLGRDRTNLAPRSSGGERSSHLPPGLPQLLLCRRLLGVCFSHHLVRFLDQREFGSACCRKAARAGQSSAISHALGERAGGQTSLPQPRVLICPWQRTFQNFPEKALSAGPRVHPPPQSAAG